MMNKVKEGSNMYGWINFTWNPIRGQCPHKCQYCYMKRFPQKELHLDEKSLNDDLGKGNTIFVGSSTDVFANKVPEEWITKVLEYCRKYPDNTYLFQSKNPYRFYGFSPFPNKVIWGTTIESNRDYKKISKAPKVFERFDAMKRNNHRKMVSIEPIMDFDLNIFVDWIKEIEPEFVSIGADSKGSKLQEPSSEKIKELIIELKKFTEVRIKPNLKRLVKVKEE